MRTSGKLALLAVLAAGPAAKAADADVTTAETAQAQKPAAADSLPVLGLSVDAGIPDGVQGSLITMGASYNHLLWNCGKDLQLVGTLEGDVYWITNGSYTAGVNGNNLQANTSLPANNLNLMANVGIGSRFYFGKVIDFGLGFSTAVTENYLVEHLLRGEFRWRF